MRRVESGTARPAPLDFLADSRRFGEERSKFGFASSNTRANRRFSRSFSSRSCLANSSPKFTCAAIATCPSGKSIRTFLQSNDGCASNSSIIFLRISSCGSMRSPAERSCLQTRISFRRRSLSTFAVTSAMLVNVSRTKNPELKPAISASESRSSARRLMALVSGVQMGQSFTATSPFLTVSSKPLILRSRHRSGHYDP